MSTQPRIVAIILAAGASTRFGSRKQLAKIGDRTLLETVVATVAEAGLSPVLAVVPPGLLVPAEAVAIPNGEPERGMSRSLQLGFGALPPDVVAAVILLGDQPTLSAKTIHAVVAARGKRPIVAASADGVLAPPLLVERSHFGLIDQLSDDIGLRKVMRLRPELVRAVRVEEHAPDIDTTDDLARAAAVDALGGDG